jgi:hypothetical protein
MLEQVQTTEATQPVTSATTQSTQETTQPILSSTQQPTQPTSGKTWKEAISEEYRSNPNIEKFTELDALAKSYINAVSMIGTDKIPLPGKSALCILFRGPHDGDVWQENDPGSPSPIHLLLYCSRTIPLPQDGI